MTKTNYVNKKYNKWIRSIKAEEHGHRKRERRIASDDAEMCVSEAHWTKRYQHWWHLTTLFFLRFGFLSFRLGPSQILQRCHILPFTRHNQHNWDYWNLIFNIFASNFFSLAQWLEMKVNICLWSGRVHFCFLRLYFSFLTLQILRKKEGKRVVGLLKLTSANQRMSISKKRSEWIVNFMSDGNLFIDI